jgi:flagellar basal-body rod protein FlgF
MSSITAITLNALGHEQARIERVATNLAHVATTAYKRETWVERGSAATGPGAGHAGTFASAIDEALAGPRSSVTSIEPSSGSSIRDLRAATLRPTARALDLALSGAGFFEVATDQGPAYTRRGDFQVDARGRLVTPHGHPVLGVGGEITLTGEHPRIDADGRITEGDRPVGQLRVLDLGADQLHALGDGLFGSGATPREVPAGQATIRQGFLENANVDMAREMVTLTSSVRHFEALPRVTQGRDDMLGTAIRKLGEV